MVVLGESVGFVAHVLQKPQGKRIASEPQRLFLARLIDLLFAFGQRHKNRRSQIAIAKRCQGRIELTFTSIDHQQIRKRFFLDGHSSKPSGNHLVNRSEIVDAFDSLDLVTPISRLKRESIEKLNQRGHRVLASQVCDVDPFDHPWVAIHTEHLAQGSHAPLWVDVKNLRLSMRIDLAASIEVL